MQVLVVEPHEGELDALELAGLDAGLGRPEAHLADLLPIGIGRLALADARDLQDRGAQLGVIRKGALRLDAEHAGGAERGGSAGRALEDLAPIDRPAEQTAASLLLHCIPP